MEQRVTLIMDNLKSVEKFAKWSVDKRIQFQIASYYSSKQVTFDEKGFKEVIDIIKKETNWLSYIRSSQLLQYSYAMIFSDDLQKEQKVKEALQNQKVLRDAKFPNSIFNYIAALFLNEENPQEHAQNARKLYDEMRKQHRFLTSTDDIAIAVLCTKDADSDSVTRATTMRKYYDELRKNKFSQGNELQALSQILTFIDENYIDHLVPYILTIREKLQKQGIKIKPQLYVQLGLLAILRIGENQLEELIHIYQLLIKEKHFKWYKNEAFLIAVQQMLTTMDQQEVGLLSMVSIEIILQMQQAVMMASIAASTAAANSSNN
ncbi:DUF4003 family protein [Solibacillus sp. FSL K6-1523]|uniref:DUF4003 family protein n=1 Tax=Solibacillus sp. FSL K6-1523 TaxID=2921471 RepID=UPI0030F9591C